MNSMRQRGQIHKKRLRTKFFVRSRFAVLDSIVYFSVHPGAE